MPKATLKHLKRFSEIKDGLSPMLSVVMIAQPELRKRLSVNDPDIREVAQRCDIVELPPLDGYQPTTSSSSWPASAWTYPRSSRPMALPRCASA